MSSDGENEDDCCECPLADNRTGFLKALMFRTQLIYHAPEDTKTWVKAWRVLRVSFLIGLGKNCQNYYNTIVLHYCKIIFSIVSTSLLFVLHYCNRRRTCGTVDCLFLLVIPIICIYGKYTFVINFYNTFLSVLLFTGNVKDNSNVSFALFPGRMLWCVQKPSRNTEFARPFLPFMAFCSSFL